MIIAVYRRLYEADGTARQPPPYRVTNSTSWPDSTAMVVSRPAATPPAPTLGCSAAAGRTPRCRRVLDTAIRCCSLSDAPILHGYAVLRFRR